METGKTRTTEEPNDDRLAPKTTQKEPSSKIQARRHGTSLLCRLERLDGNRQEYNQFLEKHLDNIMNWIRSRSIIQLPSDQSLVVDDVLLPEVAEGLRKEDWRTLAKINRDLQFLLCNLDAESDCS